MAKEQRSTKWTFLFYEESAPENYLNILEELHIPFILSPWHDKDVNRQTGEFKKSHKHGAFFFDSLKSYSQVSNIISDKLNGPAHVEVVMSPTGLFDYFTHAENPDKTPYNIEDIEVGCGFNLEKFLMEMNSSDFIHEVVDIIEENDFTEFEELVWYARANNTNLLGLIIERTYFFAKYLDSRRYNPNRLHNSNTDLKLLRNKGSQVSILMLTARDAVEDRIAGLDFGADDYLVKPFEFGELMARIRAMLRRANRQVSSDDIQIQDITINLSTKQVWRNDNLIDLTAKEYEVLEYLARHRDQVLSRHQIREHVWDYDYYGESNIIDVLIKNLRRKLDNNRDGSLIKTKRGLGYVIPK